MKEQEKRMHLPKVTIDDFFTTQEERDAKKYEFIKNISIKDITNFPNHPYQVRDDEEMEELSRNIKEQGLIVPLLLRPKENGGYELISGHRRKRACELAGMQEVKAIVREMTDEEAIIQMVDSNRQREKVLPSEKAFAYKMRLEAMKRQGERNDLTSAPMEQKLDRKTTRALIAEEVGESSSNIQRYIRLTELIPKLLDLVDEEKIKLRPAVELSYLKTEEQRYILEAMEYFDAFPSHPQAREMKKLSEEGKLTESEIDRILKAEKPNQKEQIKFGVEKIQGYFPKGYTQEQMEKTIKDLLEKYKMQWQNKQKQLAR